MNTTSNFNKTHTTNKIILFCSILLVLFLIFFSFSSHIFLSIVTPIFLIITFYFIKSNNENIFIAFLALIVLFSRTFSYIKIPYTPVYSAELFIVLSILFIVFSLLNGRSIKAINYPKIEFALLFILIIYEILYGLAYYNDYLFVLRQSAIFYYSIFFFLATLLFDSIHKINKLTKVLYISIILLIFTTITRITIAGIGTYAYFYFSIALVACLVHISLNKNTGLFVKLITMVLLILTAVSEVRAVWIGIIVALLFAFLISLRNKHFKLFTTKLSITGTIIFFTCFAGLIIAKPQAINSIYDEFVTIFKPTNERVTSSNNTRWRLYVWKDIINESMEKPVLGWGFGKKFVPETIAKLNWGGSWRQPSKYDPEAKGFQDPHNSFLSILHSTGIVGLFLFILIIGRVIISALKTINITNSKTIRTYLIALILIVICILATSLTMVVIEGPYFGIPFWVSLGLLTSLININEKETNESKT